MSKVTNNREPKNKAPWPDPTPEMLDTPEFNAVWDCIKKWDINVPDVDGEDMYSGATGNHVRAVLDALKRIKNVGKVTIEQLEQILSEEAYSFVVETLPNGEVRAKRVNNGDIPKSNLDALKDKQLEPFDVIKKFIQPTDKDITIDHLKRMLFDFDLAFEATKCIFANQTLAEVVFSKMVEWYNSYEGEDKEKIKKLIDEFNNKTRAYKDENWRNKIENMKGWMDKNGKVNYGGQNG